MAARHSASSRSGNQSARRVVLAGLALLASVLVVGLVVSGLSRAGLGGLCVDAAEVSVAAEPGIVAHVETLADGAEGCYSYEVSAVTSADMATRVASRQEPPDIWVPDSTVRLAQVSQEVQIPFETVLNSLASTPVIIASDGGALDMSTWTAVLATPRLAMGDPVRSGIADAPILAATSETETMRSTSEALGTAMAALAQGQAGRQDASPTARELLDRVRGAGGAAIVTEQQAVLADRDSPGSELVLGAPRTGAVFLAYPLAVTTQDPARREEVADAAAELRAATGSSDFVAGLAEDGFRPADRSPLAGGAGVGEVDALVVRDPNRVHATLQKWRLLAMPGRSLVLVDTSGSMGFAMEDTGVTRIRTLVETATTGLGQFPDDAALGLWAFGGDAGGGESPYLEVAPLERLDAPTADGVHRDSLAGALGSLPGLVGGGTDLYRTVLDAYAAVRSGYDPDMINSIIVISDGANDTVSDLTREDFLLRLREMVDPSEPVVVVTVGLLDDADPETLAEVSRTTGGSSHVARTSEEIVRVFAAAVGQRGSA
ncbi:substrate-binding domain-containing protein [Dietzia sp. PP-33]|uniref:substrate-binding domain-containing protein n=1 Tax=Dietzia sp. PP-33 TaxID=2957500 RepID=UPI0029B41966|nr:substrate-binding domain-containing protein [Dietzia sp. PP-33]MDX2356803.1 substrate-binding and VWA domain-containing protein [Dietzia sp. PP-33]